MVSAATCDHPLKEFLPTDEETQALKGYLAKASVSEEAKAKAMADLCACEQYMVAMLDVPNAAAKFDCMLFKTLFQPRLDEIMVRPFFEKHVIFATDILFGLIFLLFLFQLLSFLFSDRDKEAERCKRGNTVI